MMFDRIKSIAAAALLAWAGIAGTAPAATLAGDVVTVNYYLPTIGTSNGAYSVLPPTVKVAAGISDLVTVSKGKNALFTVNVDPTSIVLTFLHNVTFGNSTFNGIQVSGITQSLTGVTATGGGTASLGKSAVLINLAGLSFRTGATVTATPIFLAMSPPPGVVPLPGTLSMFAAGLVALLLLRARKRANPLCL